MIREIEFKSDERRKPSSLSNLHSKLLNIQGIGQIDFDFPNSKENCLLITGRDYNFTDVLQLICESGYSIIKDRIVKR